MTKRRIAILFHREDRHYDPARYAIHHLARFWREDGHDVRYLFGTGERPEADILIVHVNLSVVPQPYLDFASHYPRVVNGEVRDIRKSHVSRNLVRPGDAWRGPVIVKSDLNYGGTPERMFQRTWIERRWPPARRLRRVLDRLGGNLPPLDDAMDYRVFDRLADVPESLSHDRAVVVEKFRPELENGQYHTRLYQFFGNQWTCERVASSNRIVKADTETSMEHVEPHPEIVARRAELRIDYGKLDYVVCDGEVVLLDVNKTTGASRTGDGAHTPLNVIENDRRIRSRGLYSFFEE